MSAVACDIREVFSRLESPKSGNSFFYVQLEWGNLHYWAEKDSVKLKKLTENCSNWFYAWHVLPISSASEKNTKKRTSLNIQWIQFNFELLYEIFQYTEKCVQVSIDRRLKLYYHCFFSISYCFIRCTPSSTPIAFSWFFSVNHHFFWAYFCSNHREYFYYK